MLLNDEQGRHLQSIARARAYHDRSIAAHDRTELSFRRACARAAAAGIPVRRIARHANVSHPTVVAWIASLKFEPLTAYEANLRASLRSVSAVDPPSEGGTPEV